MQIVSSALRFVAATAIAATVTTTAFAESNLLFILDSSGSMWGQLDGKAKMETARTALSKLIGDLPVDTKVGLMAYGHRTGPKESEACSDIELLTPVGKAKTSDITNWLNRIIPKGKTPIARALEQSPAAFSGLEKSNNNIVLISDGIETCDGDPCAVAGELAKSNINLRVHVVGFDISEKDRAQLQCIARLGKGKYFPANSTRGFTDAVKAAVKVVAQAPKPAPPPPPKPMPAGPIFLDEFDGDALSGHWEVLNEDPDSYIVEDGKLLIVSAYNGHLSKANVANIIRYKNLLPKGNWVATIKFTIPYQTGREAPFLAIYGDKDNHMAASTNTWSKYGGIRGAQMYLSGWKRTKGKETSFSKVIWGGASGVAFTAEKAPNAILLRITKKGRTYTPAYKLEGMKQTEWIEHEKFTSLRPKGNLAFGIFQAQKVKGETPMMVDWFKIEALN